MCISFEKVSGKKSRGDRSMLEGLTKMYRDAGYKVAIVEIPVELLEIDTRYQTEMRTDRDLRYLTNNWDENKLLPLVGVPHWEEGKVYLVDGYGRWIASQIVNGGKYKYLSVLLIFSAPTDETKRLKFEAELYAFQNKDVSKMTPIQKHGAMMILEDPATLTLEKMRKKYGFEYVSTKGKREASVLGSYSETLALCDIDNGKAASYVFDICEGAGFDRKPNGYSTYIMKAFRDVYKLYIDDRKATKKFLIDTMRSVTPIHIKANAVTKYPMLDMKTAVSLYVEDMIVESLGLEHTREVIGEKVFFVKKPA